MQIICDVQRNKGPARSVCIQIQGSACSAVCRAVQNKRQNPARSRAGASLRRSRAAGQCKDGVMWTAPRRCRHACPRRSMAWWLSCGDASNARNIMRLIRPASASARTRARYQVQLLPCKHWRRRRPDEMDRASTSSPAGDRAAGAGRWRFSPSGLAATHVLLRTRSRLVARPCTATSQ